MGPLQRTPGTAPTAFSQDPPWLRRRERISLVKNRMREICTSGSVRDGDGNVPIYSAALRPLQIPAETRLYAQHLGDDQNRKRIAEAHEQADKDMRHCCRNCDLEHQKALA